jgi:transcriptional regulator with XRE-family HTH domain
MDNKMEVNKLNKIKFYRNNLGFSIYKIAELSGLAPSYISNLENDNRTNPSREAMQKISDALSESVQAVFFPGDEKE